MKILIVNTFYFPDIIGGTEISVKKLAEYLSQNGNEVVILCTGKKNCCEWQDNIKIIRRHFKNIMPFIEYKTSTFFKKTIYKVFDYYNFLNKKELYFILKEEKPDIVHTNNLFGITPIIWEVSLKFGIPIVHTVRDYFQLCPKATLKKHSGDTCTKCKNICRFYRFFYRKFSFKADVVTAPSKFTLNKYLENGYFKNSRKYAVYNAIDFKMKEVEKLYELRKNTIESKQEIHYVYIGGIEEHKGIQWLLDSFMSVRKENIRLDIAGKGLLEKIVYKSMEKDKRIKFFGFLNEQELRELLMNCDVLIIPSIWEEPFGRVVLDAYIKCMPVIGSKIGGITELIKNNKTGILVETNNQNELSKEISLLEENRELNISMYQEILKFIGNFSIENQVKEFEDIYKNIMKVKK